MDEPVALRLQAAALRRQGYSLSQIGRRLNIHRSVVARWVADVPFDGWSAESRAERLQAIRGPDLHARARDLRRAGWSYAMIAAELGVARSTLSGWLRDINVSSHHPSVRERTLAAQRKAVETNKRRYALVRSSAHETGIEYVRTMLIDGLSNRALFIAGLALYWAEGAKTHNHVSMTNSDPHIIKTFILWLTRCLNIEQERLRITVHTHPDVDVHQAESYWANVTGIAPAHFYKTQIDTRLDKSAEKYGKLLHGAAHVSVMGQGTTKLHQYILGMIAEFGQQIEEATRD